MSAHYTNRHSSGCAGCAVALATLFGLAAIACYVVYEFGCFVAELVSA